MSNELSQALHTIVDREVAHILSLKLGSSPAPSAAALLGSPDTVGSLIDHTLLAPSATPSDIVATTHAAIKHKCATICVNSSYIPLVRDTLRQAGVRDYSSPKPIAVVGFPLGTATTHSKVFEAQEAIHNGAKEIDMVQHVGYLKAKDYAYVYRDIKALVDLDETIPVKVILETCLLSPEEIVTASVIAREAGAAFIKTSTGFSTGGATIEAVQLMRAVAKSATPSVLKVKASGGVGTLEDVRRMVDAGAERIGSSRTERIIQDVLGVGGTGAAGGGSY